MITKSPVPQPGWLAKRVAKSLLFKHETARLRREIEAKVEAHPDLVQKIYDAEERRYKAQHELDTLVGQASEILSELH